RRRLEPMETHMKASVRPTAYKHRSGRKVAVQNTRAVAVGDRLVDLLKQSEALVEGEIWFLTHERMERERVLERFEEHRRAERCIVDEGAVREDTRVLPNLR